MLGATPLGIKMKFVRIPLNINSEKIDWELIELFRKRFEILWDNLHDLKLGNFSANIHKKTDGTYEGNSTLPNAHRLKGFYTDYRHFYHQNERTHIFKLMKYLKSLTDSKDYHDFIKNEKNDYKSSFIENNWLNIDSKRLNTAEVLDLWFNAEIFHDDEVKMNRLNRVRSSMSENLWKFIVFMAAYDTSLIIRNIHWSQSELSKNNLYLLMPNKRLSPTASSNRS